MCVSPQHLLPLAGGSTCVFTQSANHFKLKKCKGLVFYFLLFRAEVQIKSQVFCGIHVNIFHLGRTSHLDDTAA